jgi:two-component system cell cycle response regulator
MQDDLRLRDRTTQDLGLSPPSYLPGQKNDRPGKVVLVPSNAKAGRDWAKSLGRHSGFDCRVATNEEAVKDIVASDMPDVFVIHSQLDRFSDGLRLVSHLRSSPKSRQVAIILVVPEGDQQKAAKGLDLGASDYIFDPFDPMEMIVRLKSQIHRKQISDRLRDNVTDTLRLAVLDPLTGLYNRRYAQQHLEKISQRARETGKEFALMLLDIDNFKRVNDTYGHAGGDTVLAEFARRIQENLRGVDLISRLGGEEFLVAMPDTSEGQARIASERLRHVIETTPFSCETIPDGVDITVSIGVTLGTSQAPNVEKLVQQADQALYSSKSDGRNMVTLFNSAA